MKALRTLVMLALSLEISSSSFRTKEIEKSNLEGLMASFVFMLAIAVLMVVMGGGGHLGIL